MNLPIIHITEGNAKEFVECWARFYNYQEDKAIAPYYNRYIHKRPLDITSITHLFKWKNGNEKKIAKNKQAVVDRAIEQLALLNQLAVSWNEEDYLKKFNPAENAPIWNIFLMHIIQPEQFPIFDQHVYRAYHKIKYGELKELDNTGKNKRLNFDFYLNNYCPFFMDLKARSGCASKQVDEALWALGKFIGHYPAESLLKK